MTKIYVCAHCNRVDTQTRSWPAQCKRSSMETTEECVIRSNDGKKIVFYDADPKRVAEERYNRA